MNWLNEVLNNDPNPVETQEWIESLKAVIDVEGSERAHQLLEGMVELTRRSGAYLPFSHHRIRQYHRAAVRGQEPGQRRAGMAHPFDHPLERDGHRGARQPQAG